MTEVLLTFHCAVRDRDVVSAAIRSRSAAPLHLTEKTVRGRDFGDASTAERVEGLLRRTAIELIVEDEAVAGLVEAVAQGRRELPVRWHATPILARGRVE